MVVVVIVEGWDCRGKNNKTVVTWLPKAAFSYREGEYIYTPYEFLGFYYYISLVDILYPANPQSHAIDRSLFSTKNIEFTLFILGSREYIRWGNGWMGTKWEGNMIGCRGKIMLKLRYQSPTHR